MQTVIYTSIFPIDEEGNILVIKRAPWKKFAPNKYTGVGGTATPDESANIEKCLEREFNEETNIGFKNLFHIQFRGTILAINRDENDHLMYYFSAKVKSRNLDLSCTEGELEWKTRKELDSLDFIHTIKTCYQYVFDKKVKRFAGIIDDKNNETKIQLIYS